MTTPAAIGPYHVIRELGRGGMGVVYEVRHPDDPRRLALKTITDVSQPAAVERFVREAEVLARVRHPNVVAIHALDRLPNGRPYLVCDLVEGRELTEVCRHGPLRPRQAVELVRKLAKAVSAIHAQGILHRDLKPSNVLVQPDGTPVLLDFGLARELDAQTLTATGMWVGTPGYMAPDQAEGLPFSQLDARVDVYGLGAILYFLLSGQPPFRGTLVNVMFAILHKGPDLSPLPQEPALIPIVAQALARDRGQRYPSAEAFSEALRAWLDGELEGGGPATGWVVGLATLAVVLALGLAFVATRSAEQPAEATKTDATKTAAEDRTAAEPKALPAWEKVDRAPPVWAASAATLYDPSVRGVRVVLGRDVAGSRAHSQHDWVLGKSGWYKVTNTVKPVRGDHACVAGDGQLLLFGGATSLSEGSVTNLNDLWLHDGRRWNPRRRDTGPPPRAWHRAAYDRRRQRWVLFGGQYQAASEQDRKQYGDTWEWGPGGWQQHQRKPSPPARHLHGMTYFAKQRVVLVFGGFDAKREFGDLWAWNGRKWRHIPRGEPWPRARKHGTLVDVGRGVVLFGGAAGHQAFNDFWLWDGERWTELKTPNRPGPRTGHGMAFDPARRRVVVVGGILRRQHLAETWVWPVPESWR